MTIFIHSAKEAIQRYRATRWPKNLEMIVNSEVLQERVLFVSDDSESLNSENLVKYSQSEIEMLCRSRPSAVEMGVIHEAKRQFKGAKIEQIIGKAFYLSEECKETPNDLAR